VEVKAESAEPHETPESLVSPLSTEAVRVVETHISRLFFVGDRVYKVRKPVRFEFLDFSARQNREADCNREVALNRRLAPDVYLGVANVVMNGQAMEHMVVMRSLPQERALAQLVRSGAQTDVWLDNVALILSSFHRRAERSRDISAAATHAVLEHKWQANFDESDRFVGVMFDRTVEIQIRALLRRWLWDSEQLLADRIRDDCICDCHGDLQAEDVFCLDDGVRILDCLEFSDELRFGDVCSDVAFLAMDLERLGDPAAAERFVASYERHSGHTLPKPLLHHYIAQYAYVRAKVACLSAEQGVEGAAATARQLQLLALRHIRTAQFAMVLVGGLPGSGKSTLAAALAYETGWALLRSDEIRRDLPATEDRYSPEAKDMVYSEMLRRAEWHLARRQSVILDAAWIDAKERTRAERLADEVAAAVLRLRCQCSESVASSRMSERTRVGQDASEATFAVREALARCWDDWSAASVIDTSTATPSEEAEAALQILASG
jgi:uncharacterized protein